LEDWLLKIAYLKKGLCLICQRVIDFIGNYYTILKSYTVITVITNVWWFSGITYGNIFPKGWMMVGLMDINGPKMVFFGRNQAEMVILHGISEILWTSMGLNGI